MLPIKLPNNIINVEFSPVSPDPGYNTYDLSWGGTTMAWGASNLQIFAYSQNKYPELARVKLPPTIISVEL